MKSPASSKMVKEGKGRRGVLVKGSVSSQLSLNAEKDAPWKHARKSLKAIDTTVKKRKHSKIQCVCSKATSEQSLQY